MWGVQAQALYFEKGTETFLRQAVHSNKTYVKNGRSNRITTLYFQMVPNIFVLVD